MSHRTTEVSSFFAPDPEQPSAPMESTPSLTSTTEPTFSPPASLIAPEHTSRPRKTLSRRFLSYYMSIIAAISVIAPVVFLIVSSIGPTVDQPPPDENGVAIIGRVTQFNWFGTQELSVRWLIIGRGEYRLYPMGKKFPRISPVNRAVDVYIDYPINPAFSYDPTLLPMPTTGDSHAPQNLFCVHRTHRVTSDKVYYTPLAQYKFTAFAFVIDKATNRSIPINRFTVLNFRPESFEVTALDVPAHNFFTYNATGGPATVEVESHIVHGTITHSLHTAALIFLMFLLCWGLCLWSMYIACTVSKQELEAKNGVAFFPITLIFSVPTIRGIYMGPVPFGGFLDVVGLFPQMMILFWCAAKVLAIAIRQSIQKKSASSEREKV